MALDPYNPCPCGSGKKLKFCCSADIIPELEKVLQSLQGEQRLGALEMVERLLEKYPGRPSLLATRVMIHMQMGQMEKAEQAVADFVAADAANPAALAQSAMIKGAKEGPLAGAELLQSALTAVTDAVSAPVYDAIGVIAQGLAAQGNLLAARGHLMLQFGLSGGQDPHVMESLMQMNGSPQIPLLLKQDAVLAICPESADWKPEFDHAMQMANRGAWGAAVVKLRQLAALSPEEPAIHRNLATLCGWLGDVPETVKALRAYASLAGTLTDEAVEAEAVAQILDPDTHKDKVDVVGVTYTVTETDSLLEKFSADRRISRMPVDPAQMRRDDEPPPKGVFWLLDRPLPTSGNDLACADVPRVLGDVWVFGKQTDREARIELTATRTAEFETKTGILAEVAGDLLGAVEKEEVLDQTAADTEVLSWNWRLPDDTSPEKRAELMAEHRRTTMFERWPAQPLSVLDGKTPREAAADPVFGIRAAAAVLLMELSAELDGSEFDFNEVRTELGLPAIGPIDPTGIDTAALSLVQLARVEVEKLSDADLVTMYQRASMMNAVNALGKLATEVVARSTLDDSEQVDKAEALALLARMERDGSKSRALFQQARQVAVAAGKSPAAWLIAELSLRLEQQDPPACQELLGELQARHMQEPGIAQTVMQLLVSFGVITPEGQPVGMPGGGAAAAPAAPAATAATAAPAPPAPPATDAGGEGKSKLWVPGMD